jgi:hypothetical protein
VSSLASLRRFCCLSLLSLASAALRAAFASAVRCFSASLRCLAPVSRGVRHPPARCSVRVYLQRPLLFLDKSSPEMPVLQQLLNIKSCKTDPSTGIKDFCRSDTSRGSSGCCRTGTPKGITGCCRTGMSKDSKVRCRIDKSRQHSLL